MIWLRPPVRQSVLWLCPLAPIKHYLNLAHTRVKSYQSRYYSFIIFLPPPWWIFYLLCTALTCKRVQFNFTSHLYCLANNKAWESRRHIWQRLRGKIILLVPGIRTPDLPIQTISVFAVPIFLAWPPSGIDVRALSSRQNPKAIIVKMVCSLTNLSQGLYILKE